MLLRSCQRGRQPHVRPDAAPPLRLVPLVGDSTAIKARERPMSKREARSGRKPWRSHFRSAPLPPLSRDGTAAGRT